jgi:hypothetical protein
MKRTIVLAILVIIIIALAVVFLHRTAAPADLSSISTVETPWPPELAHLKDRLQALGLPALASEGTALHIHQHLDIFVHGTPVAVPADIGIHDTFPAFISPIHVHDTTGIIHVESPTVQAFTLGQFFDIWGVRLTATCIGGYCTDATNTLEVYVNGTRYEGDPRAIELAAHQEIVIVYGTPSERPNPIPASYSFPAGY